MQRFQPAPRFPRSALRWLVVLCLVILGGCASVPSPQERGAQMDVQAASVGWSKLRIPAGPWVLTAYEQPMIAHQAGAPLTIYIEGDGFAWRTGTQPSDDPTPGQPVALAMAVQHSAGPAAYLARPCQNVDAPDWGACQPADWTHARYAPEVVAALSSAISSLKARAGAPAVVLVGYSGGGALATLLAAERRDVVRLVTVAANLDTEAWTRGHGLLPLGASLNPADGWQSIQDLPQLHLVGARDAVVPLAVARAFVQRFPVDKQPVIRVVADADHACCWATLWPALARETFP